MRRAGDDLTDLTAGAFRDWVRDVRGRFARILGISKETPDTNRNALRSDLPGDQIEPVRAAAKAKVISHSFCKSR